VCTVLAAAAALRHEVHWRHIALALLPLPAIVGAAFVTLRLPPMVSHEEGRLRLRELLRRRVFWLALGAIALAGATELGIAQWLPAYAEKELHYSKWVSDMSLLLFSLAMVAGRVGAGLLGHRIAGVTLMKGCCWITAVLFVVACFAPWPGVRLVASILTGLTGSCLWPTMLGVTADRYPRGGVSMYGMLSAFGNAGGIFMPWIVGIMADWTGAMNWGIATALLCPLGMIALLRAQRREAAA
jgi:fucose permease